VAQESRPADHRGPGDLHRRGEPGHQGSRPRTSSTWPGSGEHWWTLRRPGDSARRA